MSCNSSIEFGLSASIFKEPKTNYIWIFLLSIGMETLVLICCKKNDNIALKATFIRQWGRKKLCQYNDEGCSLWETEKKPKFRIPWQILERITQYFTSLFILNLYNPKGISIRKIIELKAEN